jgi:AraC-like DNA-binding protein
LPFPLHKLLGRAVPTRRFSQNQERNEQEVERRISRSGPQYGVTAKARPEDRLTSVPAHRHRAEPRDIWKARRLIEERTTEQLSLSKVAKAVGINPTHLSEKFKQVTGVKFVDYIARSRFEKARRLLEDGDLRVSEIAFAVGFQSLSQFNRVFKKLSGKSPTGYRATHLRRKRH